MTRASRNTWSISSVLGNSAEFVVERNCNLGFEEFLLLLSGRHTLKVYQNSLTLTSYAIWAAG